MGNEIIIAILVVVIFIAIRGTVKHFAGQGGCCGGASAVKSRRKKLKGQVLGTYIITIDGMHCENCKNRIEAKINGLEGVACKVNLKNKTATVSFNRNITPDEIRYLIENSGYKVEDIRREELES